MLHAAERFQVFPENSRRREQGVPAGEQHIVDFRVLPDIVQNFVASARGLPTFLFLKAYHALAETMTAVHGAGAGRENQRRLAVFMLEAVQNRVGALAAGIKAPHGPARTFF